MYTDLPKEKKNNTFNNAYMEYLDKNQFIGCREQAVLLRNVINHFAFIGFE